MRLLSEGRDDRREDGQAEGEQGQLDEPGFVIGDHFASFVWGLKENRPCPYTRRGNRMRAWPVVSAAPSSGADSEDHLHERQHITK
jgi:hypothetical protein